MENSNPTIKCENLSTGYNGIVDYHNNLVQIRFTVAGLSIAADGFLASALFQTGSLMFSKILISILGVVLTFICGMLEIRTYQLLNELLKGGYALEKILGLNEEQGLFSILMHAQIVPRFLSKPLKGSAKREKKFIFSHSVMFVLLYVCVFIFWLIMLIFVLLKIV
ncbi:MAG: hypothetical protein A2X25_00350 [Chloroflexi bacterium GWB2_49_20]|nr:MAG: hypothetical protein A2X25_00350 [Chloroflexi bacterium GWB2_49_20]OGN79123.1 MAG: hypothetical protein A2X26_06200 [Chloroflexi bacterium GWC2_49_37]OGN84919.1 MAG: hypothetical protein A2X27_15240 [Chloroflexi bacterium GWD2_49_16]HCC78019.1 hypothetical protein [Anaerolineae bacterium]HCM96629.1 hypothetical protein [Anaerolineae bacterium]